MIAPHALELPNFPELNFLLLRYRADIHTLVTRWRRPVSAAEFRQGYAATLAAAETTACPFWLVDLRGRNAPDADPSHWLSTDFLPQLLSRLGAAVYLGLLLPPYFIHPLLATTGSPTPTQLPTVQYFDEEGALAQWLAQCQRRNQLA